VIAEALGSENVPGMVSSIQTFGALIHHHPHIHALVSDRAFTSESEFLLLRKVPTDVYREKVGGIYRPICFKHARRTKSGSSSSMSRIVKVTEEGKVVYRADHTTPMKLPGWRAHPNSRMVSRNYELFDPLDFLAQVTQHIPNKGEHLIHYYGAPAAEFLRRHFTRTSAGE